MRRDNMHLYFSMTTFTTIELIDMFDDGFDIGR